jgi:hypothetical protein
MLMNRREAIKNKKKITKKGILLTALIVAGIVGASFIVYLIPP